jgi:hypothetical protein
MKAFQLFALLAVITLVGCVHSKSDPARTKRMSECFTRIDELAVGAGWEPLRTASLPAGALEVRIWSVPALGPTSGIAFARNGSEWTGRLATESFKKGAGPRVRTAAPKSGWKEFWARAEPLGILTLPDSSTLGKEELFYDGGSTVVEMKRGRTYRTYHYYCAELQNWPEARQMAKIEELVYGEFGKP